MGQEHSGQAAVDHHDHPPNLAHHFETPGQQFAAGKLGMWLFLSTEILLFSGLFCAYAVYRNNHPEIFQYAHQYLDSTLGGINTVVLICSSLTMAWGVRCAQLGQRKGLIINLILTLVFACGFLGIKFVEYEHKWKDGLLPGTRFQPKVEPGEHGGSHAAEEVAAGDESDSQAAAVDAAATPATETAAAGDAAGGQSEANVAERTTIPLPLAGPAGLAADAFDTERSHTDHGIRKRPNNVHIFFGIYFTMTGLHGLHVIAGMTVIVWLLIRACKGEFGPGYFLPVDLGGLYWHLVDLVWIYLFPLLYLIH
jgi:cytochrome c oxidase subunit 3